MRRIDFERGCVIDARRLETFHRTFGNNVRGQVMEQETQEHDRDRSELEISLLPYHIQPSPEELALVCRLFLLQDGHASGPAYAGQGTS